MAKELVHSVQLHTPEGVEHEQTIYYENLPKYYTHCRIVGHTKENCKKETLPLKKAAMQVTETTEQRPKEVVVQSIGVGGKSGAITTKEWVMKMANLPIDNSA